MIHVEPVFLPASPEIRGTLDRFAEEHKDDPIGGVGGRVIFEDERVRMWELILKPGEASDLHHHELDYYLVVLEGDAVAGIPPKDSGIEPFVVEMPEAGNTVMIPAGATEWAYNVGKKTYREIIVEYKNS
jgi:mannose-6-phosphate isomerase-like protein (cupin superfamily)